MSVPPRQREIYMAGARGATPRIPVAFPQLEAAARRRMGAEAYAYVAGGAGLEDTQSSNRQAFTRWNIVPRMLRDVSQRDMSVTLWGRRLPSPLLFCPIGVLELAHRQADAALAEAARQLQIPMIFSNQASRSMEECSRILGDSPRWFQLYWSKSNELVASLVGRAERCGCEAIVVTLDTSLLGWRPRDLQLGSLPFLGGKGLAQYFTDPVFQAYLDDPSTPEPAQQITLQGLRLLVGACLRHPGGFLDNLRSRRPLRAVRRFLDIYSRTDLTWDNLAFLRQRTKLPIILKGLLHHQDALRALDMGVDGIMVSNHGGRQVDGSISSLEALEEVVAVVHGRVPVLFDSGIRCGADIYKALALGASAVGVGRPYVYGLALGGAQGVVDVAHNLLAELDLQMALTGCRSLEEMRHSDTLRRVGKDFPLTPGALPEA